jgi:nitroreductase
MDFQDLLLKNRSYRRFDGKTSLDEATLRDWVEVTRRCASASNRQPLRYCLSWDPEVNARIFPLLGWAASLPDWDGPAPGERPAGYIVIASDRQIAATMNYLQCDVGIAAQSILLTAVGQGFGGCMLGSFNETRLRHTLGIPDAYEIQLVLALGVPNETVLLTSEGDPLETPYWRDEHSRHFVPKRPLDELILPYSAAD